MQLKKVKLIVTLLVFAVTVSLSGIKASKNGSDWSQITLQTYPNTIS